MKKHESGQSPYTPLRRNSHPISFHHQHKHSFLINQKLKVFFSRCRKIFLQLQQLRPGPTKRSLYQMYHATVTIQFLFCFRYRHIFIRSFFWNCLSHPRHFLFNYFLARFGTRPSSRIVRFKMRTTQLFVFINSARFMLFVTSQIVNYFLPYISTPSL